MKPIQPNGQPLKVALLVNTHSRKGRLLYKHAKAALEARGYSFVRAVALADPSVLPEAMTDIMKHKPDLVIIGGGDGTISTASNYLAYTDSVLGYLPLGTTNNFGRGLGTKPGLRHAIEAICSGTPTKIDLGKIGTTYFTNMASFGVSVSVATETPRRLKRLFGRIIYAYYAAACTLRHQAMTVDVTTGSGHYSFTTHQFCVVSGTTHSAIPIAADASPADHKLIAYALGGRSHISTLFAVLRHAVTSRRKMADKDLLVSSELTLRFSPAQQVDIDGEVKGRAQVSHKVTIAADALTVLTSGFHQ